MPVLLDIARAPTLEALLSAAKTQGMDWRISAVPDAGLSRSRAWGPCPRRAARKSFPGEPALPESAGRHQGGGGHRLPDVAQALESGEQGRPPLRWSSASIPTCCMPAWPSGSTRRVVPRYRAARILPRWWRLTPSSKRAPASARSASWNRARASDAAPCWAGLRDRRRFLGGAGQPAARARDPVRRRQGRRRAILHSGVVLGADGFGFAPDPSLGQGAWGKIPSWAAWPSATTSRSAPTPRSIAARSKTPSWPTASSWTTRSWWVTTAASARTQRWPRAWGGRFDHHRRALHHRWRRDAVGAPDAGRRCAYFGWHRGDVQYPEAGPVYRGLPYAEHGEWQRNAAVIQQLAQLRRRARSLERVRRGSAARRTPQDHFISQEFTEKWNSTSRGSWSVCRIVTRCC